MHSSALIDFFNSLSVLQESGLQESWEVGKVPFLEQFLQERT